MRAIRVHAYGGPETLTLDDVPEPQPGAGEVLVRLDAAGVNFIDVYQRTGLYALPLPFVAGSEGAGVVSRVGPDVEWPAPGDRVGFASVQGAYSEAIVVPADRLVPIPPDVGIDVAAAILLQGMTAHYLLRSIRAFDEGDWCLIQAAAGGVGLLLTQMAKRLGLRAIGTTSTPEKADRVRAAGADHVVVYTQQDFVEAVADVTDGRGVRAVFDSVGKATFDGGLRCLAPRGTMVLFGQSSGPVDPVDPATLQRGGSLVLTRPTLVHFVATRDELLWRSGEVLSMVERGELDVHIHARYPLRDASEAHRALESRTTTGKLVLTIRSAEEAD